MSNTRTGHSAFNMIGYAVVNLWRYKDNNKLGIIDKNAKQDEQYWLDFLSYAENKVDNPPEDIPDAVRQAYIAMERARWSQPMLEAYLQAVLEREAYELGMEKAEAKGKAEGKAEGIKDTAKKLVAQGVDVNIIKSATGLSKAEILELKDK